MGSECPFAFSKVASSEAERGFLFPQSLALSHNLALTKLRQYWKLNFSSLWTKRILVKLSLSISTITKAKRTKRDILFQFQLLRKHQEQLCSVRFSDTFNSLKTNKKVFSFGPVLKYWSQFWAQNLSSSLWCCRLVSFLFCIWVMRRCRPLTWEPRAGSWYKRWLLPLGWRHSQTFTIFCPLQLTSV